MSSDQLTELARPFANKLIQQPAPGKYGAYVGHDSVTEKLLAVVGPFDFTIEEVIYGEDGKVEAVLAALTVEIDGRRTTIKEVGDCEQPTNWKTQGARIKDAASDSVKRCAMRLGVGLHLWSGDLFFLHDYLKKQNGSARDDEPEDVGAAGDPLADGASTDVGEGAGVRGSAPAPDPAADPIGEPEFAKLQPRMKAAGLTNKGLRHAFVEAVTKGRASETKELTQGDVAAGGPVYEALDNLEEGSWELVDGDEGPTLVEKDSGQVVSA